LEYKIKRLSLRGCNRFPVITHRMFCRDPLIGSLPKGDIHKHTHAHAHTRTHTYILTASPSHNPTLVEI